MASLLLALRERTDAIGSALSGLGDEELLAPSLLPGWTRRTIACHLRFGARTLRSMTADALAGRATAFYPLGREAQRAATLQPEEGEAPGDVVSSLASESSGLQEQWEALAPEAWSVTVHEPAGNRDLGPVPLARLALLRLTEVEVHGSDLDVGLPDWSATFVDLALPFRVGWLAVRRPPGSTFAGNGSWTLAATDRPFVARLSMQDGVTRLATGEEVEPTSGSQATLRGSSRDLLAFLLGRPLHHELAVDGDTAVATLFKQAFPGP